MKKQIILAMLDIEYVFDEYNEKVESLLKKLCCDTKTMKRHDKIARKHYGLLYTFFEDIYEALDNSS